MALELVQSAFAALTCPNHQTFQGQLTQDSVLRLLPRAFTLSSALYCFSDEDQEVRVLADTIENPFSSLRPQYGLLTISISPSSPSSKKYGH